MSNKEILEKAIQKAIEGGWNYIHSNFIYNGLITDPISGIEYAEFVYGDDKNLTTLLPVTSVIFNHDFARALWPNEWERRYKLAMIVNADDPIKYLGDNL